MKVSWVQNNTNLVWGGGNLQVIFLNISIDPKHNQIKCKIQSYKYISILYNISKVYIQVKHL